ncbi:HpcH/HpaI aldolase/citrate lyase family protein [Variovorax ginsengisoli]|uniref:Citrate lyase subunit beta/citryl-CoA lyase n=1 Tax=Variovorax ginsengisoli TaxID=363844 RepID=A0ABT9SDH0_9BURK|nr:CoA ester lyase [Variovorax ginsengisoli]MDP9901924.1 citrate lyase subunit beta/citryl-CoA lyase [Variovorax ginsengisoli]
MRSKLFVPASRPALFAKALNGAADAVSFDLEDAVAPDAKPEARSHLRALFEGLTHATPEAARKTLIVRVNALDTPYFAADLEAVVWPGLHIVNLPMVESAASVQAAADAIEAIERERGIVGRIGILANIESARGLRLAAEIAAAHPRVMGLQIGYGDLFAPLGIASAEPSATQFVRTAVRLAAGEAGIQAYDGAYVHIDDPEGYRRDSQAARQLGFTGRSCIHPSQIGIANEVFMPSEVEVRHAVRVVEAADHHLGRGTGAFTVDGRLVDGPFIVQAERTVALAKRLGMI